MQNSAADLSAPETRGAPARVAGHSRAAAARDERRCRSEAGRSRAPPREYRPRGAPGQVKSTWKRVQYIRMKYEHTRNCTTHSNATVLYNPSYS